VPDACAGLPDGGFASEIADLGLFEPRDVPFDAEGRIAAAREAEAAAHAVDPRIGDSDGSSVGSSWSRIVYGNSAGFLGEYASGRHSLVAESLARSADGKMQRDIWYTSRRLAPQPASDVGGSPPSALRKLGARRVPTCGRRSSSIRWSRRACASSRAVFPATRSTARGSSGRMGSASRPA
jgi:PmbA protein